MSSTRATVLIDATPLRTPSGTRGIGRYVYELLHGLADERSFWEDRFRLVALSELHASGDITLSEDLRAAADQAFSARGSIKRKVMGRRRRRWLDRAAAQARAELVHQTEAQGVPLHSKVPRLVTCYDLINLRYPLQYLPTPLHWPWQWASDFRRYALAQRVVAISERTRRDALALLRIPPERIAAVPTGIDAGRWQAPSDAGAPAELAAHGLGERPFFVYVGYGDFRKNVDVMFQVLARLRRETPVELAWAGQLDPKHLRSMKRKARAAGVEDGVRFLGFVSDALLATLYRRAIGHLFLSRLEGFGLSVAEAMSLGCPVIVARGSSTDEVAGDGGIIVDPDDVDAAAGQALRLLRDPAFRSERAQAGKESVSRFSRRAMGRGYVEQYALALR